MRPVDVKSNTSIDCSKEINDKDPKFKIDDIVKISKYKNILQKVALQIGLKKFLWLKKLKILLMISMEKKFVELFMKNNCKK